MFSDSTLKYVLWPLLFAAKKGVGLVSQPADRLIVKRLTDFINAKVTIFVVLYQY